MNDCGMGKIDSLVVSVSVYVGYNSLTDGEIQLYPNPIDDQLQIILNNGTTELTRVELYNVTECLLKTNTRVENGIHLDFSQCDQGIYLLRIVLNMETSLFRILKK